MEDHEKSEGSFLTDLKKDIVEYLELRFEVLRLQAMERAARFFSTAASALLITFFLLFFLLFLFVALAFYLSTLLGGYAAGFGVVSLFYLVLLVIFLALRKNTFEKRLTDKIVEALTDADEEEIQ